MKYSFDKIINRKDQNSLKWNKNFYKDTFKCQEELLPLWIADMDFKVSDGIQKRIKKITEHGIYGYCGLDDEYYNSIISWYEKIHNWKISKEEICFTPGIVPAISYLLEAFSKKNDPVMIFTPVYYPFKESILKMERTIIECPLIKNDKNFYSIDYLDMENTIKDKNVKILIFCSPHNPVGRVWKKDELKKIADICLKYNVLIISDEIHSDIIFSSHRHTPFLTLNHEIINNCIVCNAVGKTFNLAGLKVSNIIIKNKNLREKYLKIIDRYGINYPNTFAIECVKGAYLDSYEWYCEMIKYLEKNLEFLTEFVKNSLPKVKFLKPEGTYLAWLDFSSYNLTQEQLEHFFENKVKIAVDYGYWFGKEGKGFIRLNFACPRPTLKECLEKIKKESDIL